MHFNYKETQLENTPDYSGLSRPIPVTPLGLAGLPAGDAGLNGLVGKKADEMVGSKTAEIFVPENCCCSYYRFLWIL